MQPSEARSKLQSAVRNINWINLARVMEALASGYDWNRYNNNYWRPNYKMVELDLPWLLDNWQEICEALQTLQEQDAQDRKEARRVKT